MLQVFLEYADVEGSTKAKMGMHGRKFGGNQVVAVFYPEDKFAAEQYDGWSWCNPDGDCSIPEDKSAAEHYQ